MRLSMLCQIKIFSNIPSESIAQRPTTKSPVAHAETTDFLESVSKQPKLQAREANNANSTDGIEITIALRLNHCA